VRIWLDSALYEVGSTQSVKTLSQPLRRGKTISVGEGQNRRARAVDAPIAGRASSLALIVPKHPSEGRVTPYKVCRGVARAVIDDYHLEGRSEILISQCFERSPQRRFGIACRDNHAYAHIARYRSASISAIFAQRFSETPLLVGSSPA
jgi:hypothetical protein